LLPVFLLVFIAATSSAQIIIQQDFSSPTFPPAGWTIENTYIGGIWIWTDNGQPGNGFANGQVIFSVPSEGFTTLRSANFTLSNQETVVVNFDHRNGYMGTQPDDYAWDFAINDGFNPRFSVIFPPTTYPEWTHFSYNFDIPYHADDWNISWRTGGMIEQTQDTVFFFDIDNIVVDATGTNVQPASLGDIKALFH
jgi:hypothetical protein